MNIDNAVAADFVGLPISTAIFIDRRALLTNMINQRKTAASQTAIMDISEQTAACGWSG